MRARLVFEDGEGEAREVSLEGEVSFGVSPESDCVLAAVDGAVADRHATIKSEHGRYTLKDEGSTTGTFVNRRRVGEHHLRAGDEVEFGLDGPVARFESSDGERAGPALERRSRWLLLLRRLLPFRFRR